MYPLRFALVWLAIGLSLVALVIYGSLASGGPPVKITLSDKLVHLGAYSVLMVWFGGIFKSRFHLWILFGLFLLGLVLEVLQAQTDVRVYENLDIVMNGLGLAMGKKICRLGMTGWCKRIEAVVFK